MTEDKKEKEAKFDTVKFKPYIAYLLNNDLLNIEVEASYDGGENTLKQKISDVIDAVLKNPALCTSKPDDKDNQKLRIKFPSSHEYLKTLMSAQADLLREDKMVSIFSCSWHFYDDEDCNEYPHRIFKFFLVSDNKIVCEHIILSEGIFDPLSDNIFNKPDGYDSYIKAWPKGEYYDRANAIYWHRQFLENTQTGQVFKIFWETWGEKYDTNNPIQSDTLRPELLKIKWGLIVIAILLFMIYTKLH